MFKKRTLQTYEQVDIFTTKGYKMKKSFFFFLQQKQNKKLSQKMGRKA